MPVIVKGIITKEEEYKRQEKLKHKGYEAPCYLEPPISQSKNRIKKMMNEIKSTNIEINFDSETEDESSDKEIKIVPYDDDIKIKPDDETENEYDSESSDDGTKILHYDNKMISYDYDTEIESSASELSSETSSDES